jgi:hypothetical protein
MNEFAIQGYPWTMSAALCNIPTVAVDTSPTVGFNNFSMINYVDSALWLCVYCYR